MADPKIMEEIDAIALALFQLSQRVERLNITIHGDAWMRHQKKLEQARKQQSADLAGYARGRAEALREARDWHQGAALVERRAQSTFSAIIHERSAEYFARLATPPAGTGETG